MTRRAFMAAALVASAFAMSACATVPAGSAPVGDAPAGNSLGSLMPGLPIGEVLAQGTVLDVSGSPQLCLGAVRESYPPQCSGVPLVHWTWRGVDGSESSGDVRWGSYVVQGTYDEATFTITQPPMMLALYDPLPPIDPTGGTRGHTSERALLAIQDELPGRLGAAFLSSGLRDGRLWVQVVWDDGTWQKAADDDFGKDVVIIHAALTPIG